MDEIWKDINEYEGLYQVSNLGRVKSCNRIVLTTKKVLRKYKGKIMVTNSLSRGYCIVNLSKNNIKKNHLISRLVANAFIENKDNNLEVNHKNGNKLDNKLENLEWISHKKNQEHAIKNKLYKMLPVIKIENSIIVEKFNSINEAARKYNLRSGNVWGVCEGKRRQSKGHYFEYEKK
jgi:hypothetical protein